MNGNTYTNGLDYQSQQNQQQGGFAPQNQQSHQQGGFGPQNQQSQQQGGFAPQQTHGKQPLDKAYLKIVRKYIKKKVNGQVVIENGQPVMQPLYKIIGEVVKWPANTPSGFFDKVEYYPDTTIGEKLTDGFIDWQSQNQNQQGR